MSELNKEEKKPFKVKVWVLILIYFIIAASVTTGLIIFKNSNKAESTKEANDVLIENDTYKRKELEAVRKITLKDKYARNNIELKTVEEEIGEEYNRYDYNDDGIYDEISNRISIDYLQIDGLINSYVEKKINDKILNKVEELKKEYIKDEHKGKINISVNSYSPGYANVLSIDVCAEAYDATGEEYYTHEKLLKNEVSGLNIRLDTGEEIVFEELFTKDTDINFIIAQSAYENIVRSMKYVEPDDEDVYSWDFDMDSLDYGLIENDVIRYVNKFNRNLSDLKFTFTERMIVIYFQTNDNDYGIEYFTIDMYDFVDNIAIYTRFLTDESLYVGGDLEARTYVFRYALEEEYASEYEYDEISNNVLVQISSNAGPGYEADVKQRVEKVKNYLIREADPTMVYICSFYIDLEDMWEYGSGYVRRIPKNYYEEHKDYILRYIDNMTDMYEEPNFDESKIEYLYFDLYFDQNNDVTMVMQGEDYEPVVEGGSDAELPENEVEDLNTNTNTANTATNTVIDSAENIVSNNTTIGNTTVVDNTIVEEDNTNTVYTNATNTTAIANIIE